MAEMQHKIVPGEPMLGEGIVYVSNTVGHRHAYNKFLARRFGLRSVTGAVTLPVLFQLARAPTLFFSTIEDDRIKFSLFSLVRALFGLPTAGLLINPLSLLRQVNTRKQLSAMLLKAFKRVGKVRILTIIPLYAAPKCSPLVDDWVYDPQFWDIDDDGMEGDICTDLARDVLAGAAGRPVLLFIGRLQKEKGIDFLLEIIEKDASLCRDLLVQIAGKADASSVRYLDRLREAGVRVDNRYLADEEVLDLKKVSDCIWACYDPTSDSSSGLFGRALQLGKHAIIRKGSLLERISRELGYPALCCDYGDVEQGQAILRRLASGNLPPLPDSVSEHCRQLSETRIRSALGR